LTGNPYPSAIDLSAFNEQTNCTGIAYFWEQDKTVFTFVQIIKEVMDFPRF
jgi:hypothetical protein